MAASSRSDAFSKLFKVLKKHYKPYVPERDRSVLEHLLFAACLENATYDAAEEAFAAVTDAFFDFNEVRVSSSKELGEVMQVLPEPDEAGARLRRSLQSVFESQYSFDLEPLRKQSLGEATKKLEKSDGCTPFMVAYVTQFALGGHAIPIDKAAVQVFLILGMINEKQAAAFNVPGLDRSVTKSKGIEQSSLLHQFAAELFKKPYESSLHKILLEVDPECKERLPKRSRKKPAKAAAKSASKKTKKKKKKQKAAAPAKAKKKRKAAKKKAGAAKKKKKKTSSRRLARRKPR